MTPVTGRSSTTAANAVTGGTFTAPVVQTGTINGGVAFYTLPPQQPPVVNARQLPRPAPHFTDRDTERAALDAARATGCAAVLLSGIAGVGKSALAAHWLHAQAASADVQLHADLENTSGTSAETVLPRWLRALGVERAPADMPEAVGLWRSLTTHQAVQVLIDGAVDAEQVRPLLPAGPRSFAVVTSRRLLWELSADGALVVPVMPLCPRDAVQLLCATAGDPEASTLPGAGELAEACAHLPLPLVLTGSRLRARPGRPLASTARISGPSPHLPQEHTRMAIDAINTALDATYADLHTDAQHLYRALGVLPARTVDADLAAAVCEASLAEAQWRLEILAEQALLGHVPGGNPDSRYRMGDAVRNHAYAKALATDTAQERRAAVRRLCDWMLTCARGAQRLLTSAQATLLNPGQGPVAPFADKQAALVWLDEQEESLLPVLTAAESAGWDELVFGLVDAWWPHFLHHPNYKIWITAHEIGVAAARRAGAGPAVRQLLASGAIGLSGADQPNRAIQWYEQVLEAARAAGDTRDEGQALLGLGACHLETGQLDAARQSLDAARSRWEACGYPRGVGLAEITLAEVCLAEANPTAARVHLTSAHHRLNGLNEAYEGARALALHGHARAQEGEIAEGIAELEQALETITGSTRWEARTREWLGLAHHDRGDTTTAHTFWVQAADLYETLSRSQDAARLRRRAAEQ
ncbi:hypothetical protein ABZV92_19190 [Streptomyces rubiginosohelvolus]|uniref:hypothetical protein n=1 Tax=Streptomyces rubiginosohelvolus TaxID=67362 RepID=UPI0033A84967